MVKKSKSKNVEKKSKYVKSKVQPASADEQNLDKINIEDGKGFLFDAVIVRLDIPSKTIDESSQLLVNANFNEINFSITSSRINVLDFKPERSIEFVANPSKLREQLSKNPLSFKVIEGGDVLGYGSLKWPNKFLSDLAASTGEIRNTFEIELKKSSGASTGVMQVMVRLQPKCEEYDKGTSPDAKCLVTREIDPSDVFFMVDEEKNGQCCSQIRIIPALESDFQSECLDLSSFRVANSQNVCDNNILTFPELQSQKIKPVSDHYQKLIDAVKTRKEEHLHLKESEITKDKMFYAVPSDSCLKNISLSSISDNEAFAAKNVTKISHRGNIPELIETEPKSLKRCPLCEENMEYLPKLAACPKCCYKPIPCFKEKPYNVSQSGVQLIKDFYNKLQTNNDSVSDTNSKNLPNSRCTCKYGSNKPCTHCRVQKLCKHTFQSPSPPTIAPAVDYELKSSDVDCVSSSENRPFLTRIFSELKDLYDIEEPKEKQFEIDERCERELNKEPEKKINIPLKKDTTAKVGKTKTSEANELSKPQNCRKRRKCSLKNASDFAVRSRLYDYQLVRKISSPHMGQKTCINGLAGHKNVPPNMGWLWNIHSSGKWKPGAIRKPIKELMRYFLKDFPADTLLVSQYAYRKTTKSKSNNNDPSSCKTIVQKPTLHIHKKNGEYIITMRPLKPREVLRDAADPYENMKPIQLRITKNPHLETVRNLKKNLKSMGFKKCTCHRPITYCYCRSFVDKKNLEYQCNKECSRRQMEPCCDTLVLSDTSESEGEFDFGVTPPVGVIKLEKLKNIDLVNASTQYDELDWNPLPLFPRPPNKYMQMYQCAVKDRKANPAIQGNIASGTGTGLKGVAADVRKGYYAKRDGAVSFVRDGGRNVHSVTRGGGDGVFRTKKGSTIDKTLRGKHGSRGDSTSKIRKEKKVETPRRKVNMMKYMIKRDRKMARISPGDPAAKRKERLALLQGVSPPLLCMVDRLGKPLDPCAACFDCDVSQIC